ncbi:MAG: ABC transporter ATP-binding protein [Clostridiaceae bacterium]|nr:ABC transporter ATP-binding protein [Clostridiaceae bacterium]
MLAINNLTFSYDGTVNVLDDISFTLEKGRIYCLLGINGAGKTTLFNCLTGFLKSNLALDEKLINEKILYIQDKMNFYNNLTGIEFINLIFNLKNKKLEKEEFNSLLESLQMQDKIKQLISSYSLGTKQKLVLIIGFLLKYEYIFLDEPFGAIDFISAEIVIDFLRAYKEKNNTIVLSTHLIDIAQEVADDILFLNNGKIYKIKNNFTHPKEIKKWIRDNLNLQSYDY